MPDCLPKQSPRSKQEHDGEDEQAWDEQKCSASQVVCSINNLNEGDQDHESGQHPPSLDHEEKKQHHREREISGKHIICIDLRRLCHGTPVCQERRIYLTDDCTGQGQQGPKDDHDGHPEESARLIELSQARPPATGPRDCSWLTLLVYP